MRASIERALLLLALIAAPAAAGIPTSFTEDFTTQAYMDPAGTTAEWGGGELSLLDFVPESLGGRKIGGVPYEVVVQGDLAYVACGEAGLMIDDVSGPAASVQLGTYNTGGTAWDLEVSGGHAYLADGTGGLCVVDVSDPAAPTLAAVYDPGGDWRAVALSGSTLFMAAFDGSWRAVDVSDPTAPAHLSLTSTYGSCYGLAVDGMRLYLMAGAGGVFVYDVSDPASPVQLDTYNTAGSAFKGLVDGDRLYVADGTGLLVFTVAPDGSLTLTGSLALDGYARNVERIDQLLLVSGWDGGLHLVNVADPAAPSLQRTIATGGYATTAILAGETAYVGNYYVGIPSRFNAWRVRRRLDTPVLVAEPLVPDSFALQDFARSGDVLFALGAKAAQVMSMTVPGDFDYGSYEVRLLAFDRSDPGALTLLDSELLYSTSSTRSLQYYGGLDAAGGLLAYCYEGELRLVDVSDPANMTPVGSVAIPDAALHVALSGTRAFTAGVGGLTTFDIADPALPALTAGFAAPGHVLAMALDGQRLYAANDGTLYVVDVSDPDAPATLGTLGGLPTPRGLAVDGGLLLMSTDDPGLQVIDVADPAAPVLLASPDIGYRAAVFMDGNTAFLRTYDQSYLGISNILDVVDLSLPASPIVVGALNRTVLGADLSAAALRQASLPAGDLFCAAAGPFCPLTTCPDYSRRVEVSRVFDPWLRSDLNAAASTALAQLPVDAGYACLDIDADGVVNVELSLNGGGDWTGPVTPGVPVVLAAGTEPMWRATLASDPATPWQTPECRSLTMSWRYTPAVIEAITDVPEDQGGWVRVHVIAAADDRAGASTPVTAYDLYRRIDDPQLKTRVLADAELRDDGALAWEDRVFRSAAKVGVFPDGLWEVVATAHARQQDSYIMLSPTVADSTAPDSPHGVFVVTTHTTSPTYWHVSPPDSARSVDNLPPPTPTSFAVDYAAAGNELAWDPSPADDLAWYVVHRGTTPDFTPTRFTEVAIVVDPSWSDPLADPWDVYYKVAAVDIHGNASLFASAGETTDAGNAPPARFALAGAAPNPFNPKTEIRIDVPLDGGPARVTVFDLRGRRVRLLHDGPLAPGRAAIAWDGRDDGGREVPGGTYVVRMKAGGVVESGKVMLVR